MDTFQGEDRLLHYCRRFSWDPCIKWRFLKKIMMMILFFPCNRNAGRPWKGSAHFRLCLWLSSCTIKRLLYSKQNQRKYICSTGYCSNGLVYTNAIPAPCSLHTRLNLLQLHWLTSAWAQTARAAVRYTCLLWKHVCFQNKAGQCLHSYRCTLCVTYTVCRFIIISVLFPFVASSASHSSGHSSRVEVPASQPTPLKPLEHRNFWVGEEEMIRLDSVPWQSLTDCSLDCITSRLRYFCFLPSQPLLMLWSIFWDILTLQSPESRVKVLALYSVCDVIWYYLSGFVFMDQM